jgi:hypothetical protein
MREEYRAERPAAKRFLLRRGEHGPVSRHFP